MTVHDPQLRPGFVAAVVLLVVGIVPTVLHNVQGVSAKIASRQAQIQNLSETEKLKLQQNYLQYRRLSLVQRENYKQLLQHLDLDRQNNGDLNQIATRYQTWLKTLTLKQIEELRSLTTTKQRIAGVQRLLQAQKAHRTDPVTPYRNVAPQHREVLDSMADVIRQELNLTPTQTKHLHALTGYNQCIYLLSNNLKRYAPKSSQRELHWPPPRLAALMIEKIPHGSTRTRIQNKDPSRQVANLETILANALARELERQVRPNRLLWNSKTSSERVRDRLAPELQERISQLPQQDRLKVIARELALADLAKHVGVEIDDLRRVVDWVRANTEYTKLRIPSDRKSSAPFRPGRNRSSPRPRRD
ncbi:MAG: hypothetical protein ABGZ17_20635 [Planctomycetaceae bacterium]